MQKKKKKKQRLIFILLFKIQGQMLLCSRGFPWEATEAERHDGDEIASPLVKVLKKCSVLLCLALEMKVTFTPQPTCAPPLFCLKDDQVYPKQLASQAEIIRTYIDLTKMGRGWGICEGLSCLIDSTKRNAGDVNGGTLHSHARGQVVKRGPAAYDRQPCWGVGV